MTVDIPKELYEFARGDNITLPCNFKPSIKPSLVIVTWSAEAEAANAKEVRFLSLCDGLLALSHNQDNSNSSHFSCVVLLTEIDPHPLFYYFNY